jgi:UDP-N-acetylglucosamine 4-epimerase
VVQANLRAATTTAEGATATAYNVACANAVSLNELFTMLRDGLAGNDSRFESVSPEYHPFRAGDIRFSRAQIEKASRVLSFAPTHTVAQGLQEALQWYVDQWQRSSRDNVVLEYPDVTAGSVGTSRYVPLSLVAS